MTNATRVLIVEDNVDLAENIADILSERNVEGVVVENAEEANKVLDTEHFDGVITDLRLPGMSGADLIATLRGRGHSVPIIVVSAYATDDAIDRVEELGALDVLDKPVSIDRLLAAVSEFTRKVPKVLVLEDSAPLAENVADVLRERNLEPLVFATVEGAIRQRHLPKVAVVDLRLSDGSGLEAIRRLVARDPSIRILLTTGFPSDLDDTKELDCIEHPILEKPVSMSALADRVEAATRWTKGKRS